MNQDKAEKQSPFAALTWQEQQDRWLAWRSRQLDYQPAGSVPPPVQLDPSLTGEGQQPGWQDGDAPGGNPQRDRKSVV